MSKFKDLTIRQDALNKLLDKYAKEETKQKVQPRNKKKQEEKQKNQ